MGRWFGVSTEREIRELFLIRIEMEALAARLAATADAPERRARFVAAIEPIYSDSPRNACNYLKENAAFHDAVMALADNIELRNLAIRLQLPLIMAQVGDVLTPSVLEASVREHRAIAEAILKHDPSAASARMREHLQRASALALAKRAAGAIDESGDIERPAPRVQTLRALRLTRRPAQPSGAPYPVRFLGLRASISHCTGEAI